MIGSDCTGRIVRAEQIIGDKHGACAADACCGKAQELQSFNCASHCLKPLQIIRLGWQQAAGS
jgi:hypothetical protein